MLVPDLLLDELYKKYRIRQASFIHTCAKGSLKTQKGCCFDPKAEVKESFNDRGTSLALAKPSEAPKGHGTTLGRETRLKSLLKEAGRLNDAHLRGYFNFETGRSIALDRAQSIIMLPSSITCKLFCSWLFLDQVPSHGAKTRSLPISRSLICLLMHYS